MHSLSFFSETKLAVNHETQSNELYVLVWAAGHSDGLLGEETHLVQTQVCHMGKHWWRHRVPEFQHGAASVTAGQSCPLHDSALPSSSALSWPSAWTFPMNTDWFHVLLFCSQDGHWEFCHTQDRISSQYEGDFKVRSSGIWHHLVQHIHTNFQKEQAVPIFKIEVPWRHRKQVPKKLWHLDTRWQSITSQNTLTKYSSPKEPQQLLHTPAYYTLKNITGASVHSCLFYVHRITGASAQFCLFYVHKTKKELLYTPAYFTFIKTKQELLYTLAYFTFIKITRASVHSCLFYVHKDKTGASVYSCLFYVHKDNKSFCTLLLILCS